MAKKNIQNNKEKVRDMQEVIEGIQEALKKQQSAQPMEPINIPEGANMDMQQLANIFVSRGFVADLEKRVEFCEGKTQKNEKMIDNNDKRISDLEAQYRSLASTLASLDSKIAGLSKISAISTSVPLKTSGTSGAEMNSIMEILQQLQFAISTKAEMSQLED